MFILILIHQVSLALCLIAAVFAEDKKPGILNCYIILKFENLSPKLTRLNAILSSDVIAPPTHWNYAGKLFSFKGVYEYWP